MIYSSWLLTVTAGVTVELATTLTVVVTVTPPTLAGGVFVTVTVVFGLFCVKIRVCVFVIVVVRVIDAVFVRGPGKALSQIRQMAGVATPLNHDGMVRPRTVSAGAVGN